ncbi:MAG: mechanosensitive ion channel domain-containing protein [Planctomycetota bacterium]
MASSSWIIGSLLWSSLLWFPVIAALPNQQADPSRGEATRQPDPNVSDRLVPQQTAPLSGGVDAAELANSVKEQLESLDAANPQEEPRKEHLEAASLLLSNHEKLKRWNEVLQVATTDAAREERQGRVAEAVEAGGTSLVDVDFDQGQQLLDGVNKLLVELRLTRVEIEEMIDARNVAEAWLVDAQGNLEIQADENTDPKLAEALGWRKQASQLLLAELLPYREQASGEQLLRLEQQIEQNVSTLNERAEALKGVLSQRRRGRIQEARERVSDILRPMTSTGSGANELDLTSAAQSQELSSTDPAIGTSGQILRIPAELPESKLYTQVCDWLEIKIATEEEAASEDDDATSWLDIANKHDAVVRQMKEATSEKSRWSDAFTNSQKQLTDARGANRWIVKRLRRERSELPNSRQLSAELADLQEDEQRADSLNFDVGEAIRQLNEMSNEQGPRRAIAIELRTVLTTMSSDISRYIDDLLELATTKSETIRKAEDYRAFIDKQLIWTPSAPVLGGSQTKPASQAGAWLLSLENWQTTALILLNDFKISPVWYILFLLVLGWLVVNQGRFLEKLKEYSRSAGRKTCIQYEYTGKGLLETLLISVPVSFAMLFVAWRINVGCQREAVAGFPFALSCGLFLATKTLFPMSFLRQICRPYGLGVMHFDWRETQTHFLHRNLRWLIDFSVPLIVVIGIFVYHAESAWEQSLGRIAFLILMVLLGVFFIVTMHPGRGVFSGLVASQQGGWLDRLKYLWYPMLIGLPFGLGLLSFWGYHYTSQQLASKIDETLWMVIVLTVGYCLLKRWFVLKRRALMMEQARQRLLEASQKTTSEMPVKGAEDEQMNLVAMNDQTKRMVTSLFVTTGLILAYVIWSDVLPAIYSLERAKLWDVTIDGEVTSITLANLLLLIPVVLLTIIATRNVPGLLEIALLQHLPLTNGARYAITTIARYLIAGAGVAMACGCLRLQWSSVQWLVAAFGVGLGFGLQEIFANFISGIILLFEQPIRVGDVVTIDGTTGTVTKIRMRATTIVNWDRQELIVPNKELITGKLINWTLSDTTNRVVVNVGVAYGSDAHEACVLAKQVCLEHPNIMKEPGPIVTFEGFGDNTLNLVLRAYLATLDNRLSTVHELHEQIYRSFNEAGIEIAFPQRDLHIRSVPESLAGLLSDGSN